MKAALAVIAVLVILALIVGGAYASSRNQMVRLNEQVKSNWAQVDVVLQRRADLIPNLVATVQGFAAHEQTVFDDIAKARTQYMNAQTPADKIAASNQITPLVQKVLPAARELSRTEIQRELPPAAGRTSRHRKSHRRRAQALQRFHSGIQHLHRPVPQQYLRRMGRLQTQQRLLPGSGSIARSPESSIPSREAVSGRRIRAVGVIPNDVPRFFFRAEFWRARDAVRDLLFVHMQREKQIPRAKLALGMTV